MPTYASKKLKTLTFGASVVYNPKAPMNEEKLRIVDALQASIEAIVADEEETLRGARETNEKGTSDEH